MSPDYSWITPWMAVGGAWATESAPAVQADGVRYVIDVRGEARDDETWLARHGMELLHLPTEDMRAVSQGMLDSAVHWSAPRLAGGGRLLVHCQHGIGRSALVALCLLVSRGHDALEALRAAKAARAKVSPSAEQLEAFRDFSARWAGLARVPELDALTRVAWSTP